MSRTINDPTKGCSMIAFTFPGQGSQKSGMGEAWIDHPSWELVDEASEASGRDVGELLLTADDAALKETRNSQLATFAVSMVAVDAVSRLGIDTGAHAGHSLGEYSALASSGVLDFADAVRLVTERGEAMQIAAEEHEGTMAAVLGLDDELVEQACADVDQAWVANYNAPGQVVIAGSASGVAAAGERAKELGAKRALALPVGGAFHTEFMAPAAERLAKAIAQMEFRDPDNPVYANVDAAPHTSAADWAGLLNQQLCSPVRWRYLVEQMIADGSTTFVEIGPGTALTGMAKRISKGTTNLTVNTPADLDTLLEAIGARDATEPAAQGETLYATERLVVSPGAGVFEPELDLSIGSIIETGALLGQVGHVEVRSAFAGQIMGYLAVAGERVTAAQPIAWLRSDVG